MLKKEKGIKIFIYLIVYKLFLDISYVEFVHRLFEYMGFYLDFNLSKYILSIIFFVFLYKFLPKDQEKPSSLFLQLHFIIMIMPIFTIYAYMNKSTLFFLMMMSMFLFQCMMIRLLPNITVFRIKNSKLILYTLLISLTGFVYFSMVAANGLPSLTALNILTVYDIRSNVSYPFLMAYLSIWQVKVINPFLITLAYLNKNHKLLIISVFLQVFLYLIMAQKTILFIPLAIIFIIKVLRKWNPFETISMIAALSTLVIFLTYKATDSIIMSSFFLRRFLFLPALIKFLYYDFFSENGFLFFSSSSLGKIFGLDYAYNLPPANLIGSIYFNNPLTGANTGYLAESYSNMGFFGMFIMTNLLIFILKFIDSLTIGIGKELVVGLTLFSIISLNDVALQTSLLTGGLLFLLIVLYLYSNANRYDFKTIK